MEELALSETEARYFGDLFLCCDEEADGRAPLLKATELFRSSNISNEALKQIMDISVVNPSAVSHMNRKQFYSALKLIAAHQANMTLKPELLSTHLDLPLPRFTWALNSENNADLIQLSNSPKEQHLGKRERGAVGLGCYAPMRLSNLSDSDITQHQDNTEPLSTDSEVESETLSQRSDTVHPMRNKSGSPWSTASESPTPTNSVAERQPHPVWENSATGRGVWPTNTAEEHTQLLGTEEESSDRHSSEEEGEGEGDSVWAVTAAQARHYATQFAQLQPDAHGLLPGQVARLFFEKSRLPVADLRKIWQLSDVTADGALSLSEFSIAMHLIVLRRNNVPVPDALPACLLPEVHSRFSQQSVTTDLVDLGSDMFSSGTSADFNLGPKEPTADPYEPKVPKKEDRRTSLSPKPDSQTNNKEWTKFVDSPTSSVSSPGPKPVNFDFKPVISDRDAKILHPVALRVTPDASSLPQHGEDRSSASPHAFDLASPKRLNSVPPTEAPPNGSAEIKPVQRPQAKKPLKAAGALPPPPARESSVHADDGPQSLQYAPKKEAPPPPPPRPLRSHARSSSLDLNRLGGPGPTHPAPPPPPPLLPPPAPSPPQPRRLLNQRSEGEDAFAPSHRHKETEFANFAQFEGAGSGLVRNPNEPEAKRHGAFEVYRKPASREPSCEAEPDARSLQEQNSILQRVCRALCVELADVQRERESLRLRLDSNGTAV